MKHIEIICIIDRSGSMESIRDDAIGGFNSFLQQQQALPGNARLTLVLFDHQYDIIYNALELKTAPRLSRETFVPRGSTALLDAIGRTIDTVGERLHRSDTKPHKVVVVILTDGLENVSHQYSHDRIASMIEHQQTKYSWEFIFLAANQDAFATGQRLNIRRENTANFEASSEGTRAAFAECALMMASINDAPTNGTGIDHSKQQQ